MPKGYPADHQFAGLGKRGCGMIIGAGPSPARNQNDISARHQQRLTKRGAIASDHALFHHDPAVAFA
jgi:hypothetical protein